MKNLKSLPIALIATFYLLLFTFNSSAQNVGINSTGADPDDSALLDLKASDKGFLITRAEPANIDSPVLGLMTLAPSDSCLYMFSGTTWISLGGAGSNCKIPFITSTTGKIWMDRNLGAEQVATSSDDEDAYGDLYQWGRSSDGHEKRTSGTTATQSSSDTPEHSDFITGQDWLDPKNDNLWQDVNGINNPCPIGYRIPTKVEITAEYSSWTTQDAAGALDSPLKLPMAGFRLFQNGSFNIVGDGGRYWTSTVDKKNAANLRFDSNAKMDKVPRAMGYSVRCIQHY